MKRFLLTKIILCALIFISSCAVPVQIGGQRIGYVPFPVVMIIVLIFIIMLIIMARKKSQKTMWKCLYCGFPFKRTLFKLRCPKCQENNWTHDAGNLK